MRDTQAADILGSWKEAVESCGSLDWENLCQEAVNQYSARIIERSPREYERWNDVVMAVKPASEALVREKVRSVVADHNLPKAFVDAVKWDILHVFLEAEFADVYPPGFYASQAYWYTKGHFPCGWRGVFPEGRLVVY
ncbi:MAG TPA: hypothetical protein VFV07_12230 [Rhizomicrobium sp.]|nr:hypothetical protein [Rhizomicrobium sp.]